MNRQYIMLAFACFTSGLHAQIMHVRSDNKFYRVINHKPFALVIFYEQGRRHDPQTRNINDVVRALHHDSFYKMGGLQFLKVDTERDNLQEVAKHFGVTAMPAAVLFKNGAPVRNKQGALVMTRTITQSALRQLIDDTLGDQLQDRVDEKIEEREDRAAAMSYYWYSPYWNYYGPYWGWGWGWRNPW